MTSNTLTRSHSTRWHIIARTALALLGGYIFTWGVIAIGVALMFGAGMEFHDAEHLSYIIGILVYLGAFLAGFAARDLRRVALVLVGGGALLSGAAWLLQQQLV
jgi:hypothetical protein